MESVQCGSHTIYFVHRDPQHNKGLTALTHPAMLAENECLGWLDTNHLEKTAEQMSNETYHTIQSSLQKGSVLLANTAWRTKEDWCHMIQKQSTTKKSVHILALGDVGSTVLTALKLMGSDCIQTLGIYDMNPAVCARWETELNQAAFPWEYDILPKIEILTEDTLFDCDMFVFCASKGIPPVGAEVQDVRMVQYEANKGIISSFAKKAREKQFQGIFAVVSDPVDPLCHAAFVASNQNEEGVFDAKGLRPEQIQGYGLGVMNARAAYYAKKDARFADFLTEGRAFGPHGQDLVIANSITHYDDTRAKELTKLAIEANLRMRELGFKPYVAPAISSAAISILLTLRGEWHYSSNFINGVYMGSKNRTQTAVEIEQLPLPSDLFARIQNAFDGLEALQ